MKGQRKSGFVRRRLSAWLVPTLLAPALSSALLITLRELSSAAGALGVARWLALLAVSSVAAVGLSLSLLLVDWVLLLLRRRTPPAGSRAWLSGAVAPLPAYGLWLLLRPPLLSAPSTHVLAVVAALLAAALAVRLVTSPRPSRRFRFV